MFAIVLVLIIISIALSLFSLRGILHANREATHTKKELEKGRVVYQNDSALSKE